MIMKRLLKMMLGLTLYIFLTGAATYNIDPDNDGSQYCWSENAGWINFQSATGGVFVSSTSVSGKAWGENIGWINLSPVNGGVVNDGYGNLSGYAWGENVGWINFAPTGGGINIDLNGNFIGKAWGENIGWINCNPGVGGGVRTSWLPPDNDGDGYIADVDCNDNDPNIHPGAFEVCNGLDDNCNRRVDEYLPVDIFNRDADADGYGTPAGALVACSQPAGYVGNNFDCNDDDPNIRPGATEICNGVDDNCNGSVDEGVQNTYYKDSDRDSYGNPQITIYACSLPEGYAADNTDCDDKYASVHPGAPEICRNELDDNCNGLIDEGNNYYPDQDKDGYGDPQSWKISCDPLDGFVLDNTDCNDADELINPPAKEVCDGDDNNCNKEIDEGFDADGDSIADCFDNCPKTTNKDQLDTDKDGFGDMCDNCSLTANPGQQDTNGDGYGNTCDCDLDNNNFVGPSDFNIFKAAWLSDPSKPNWNADADFDSNNFVGASDFNIFKTRWLKSGPWK